MKKRYYISLAALLVLAGFIFYKYYYVNPYADHNIVQKELLNSFYGAFRTKDYGSIADLMSNHNPQMVITVRHWYGEVTSFQIKEIRKTSATEKKAVVSVTSRRNNEQHVNTDYLILTKGIEGWKIRSYESDLDYKLPG
ncbi:hypothetical protein NLX71_07725 [Paenibacillus sp. MZ04-78.2]|uniref:hypothetical protein n=1 Tax=Paenibacillus sp. MZ04-78.2 TaxID=2962034 RepID=UPI0020B8A783|nr:hypothetical protein [Paenibacillus sp. MZ04-78.2]MCP3773206.1 hypothetical protein [Paenibacillus sp. MZ04-78.2]